MSLSLPSCSQGKSAHGSDDNAGTVKDSRTKCTKCPQQVPKSELTESMDVAFRPPWSKFGIVKFALVPHKNVPTEKNFGSKLTV